MLSLKWTSNWLDPQQQKQMTWHHPCASGLACRNQCCEPSWQPLSSLALCLTTGCNMCNPQGLNISYQVWWGPLWKAMSTEIDFHSDHNAVQINYYATKAGLNLTNSKFIVHCVDSSVHFTAVWIRIKTAHCQTVNNSLFNLMGERGDFYNWPYIHSKAHTPGFKRLLLACYLNDIFFWIYLKSSTVFCQFNLIWWDLKGTCFIFQCDEKVLHHSKIVNTWHNLHKNVKKNQGGNIFLLLLFFLICRWLYSLLLVGAVFKLKCNCEQAF